MKKIIIILVYNFLFCFSIYSQDSQPLAPTIFPPSPTAAGLGKYTDIPVSYYTGTPNINIPIWNISHGNLNLPISLSYHASGIKVEEIPSWVGLGWSLNAGGVINRTLRGEPDERTGTVTGYFTFGNEQDLLSSDLAMYNGDPNDFPFINWSIVVNLDSPNEIESLKIGMDNGTLDGEPDIFTFNFNGYAGKIVYNATEEKLYIIPNQQLIVDYTIENNNIIRWEITTDKGIKYVFGKSATGDSRSGIETTSIYRSPSPYLSYNSSWFLVDIIDLSSNRSIKLDYSTSFEKYDMKVNRFLHNGFPGFSLRRVEINSKKISSISSQDCNVNFNSSNRSDLKDNTGIKLDEIVINDKNNNLIKLFALENDYFISPGFTYATEPHLYKRLKLNKVTEQYLTNDGSILETPPFIFSYNDEILPNRLSNGKDHWGFYNGQISIPDDALPIVKIYENQTVFLYGSAIREPDESKSKACLLEEIQYPTGGKTKFTFEGHDIPALEKITKENSVRREIGSTNGSYEGEMFNVNYQQWAKINHTFEEGDWFVYGELYKEGFSDPMFTFSSWGTDYPEVLLSDGNYYLKLIHVGILEQAEEISIEYLESTDNFIKKPIGGVRIKTIEHYDNDELKIKQYYQYERLLEDTNIVYSSGITHGFPKYWHYSYPQGMASGAIGRCGHIEKKHTVNENNIILFGSENGSHICYSEVSEFIGGKMDSTNNGHNGKVHYTYSSPVDYPDYYDPEHPSTPAQSYNWLRGRLLTKSVFDKEGILVKYTKNTYKSDDIFTESINALKMNIAIRCDNLLYPSVAVFYYKPYCIPTGWSPLIKSETITYNNNDTSAYICDSVVYCYDNQYHLGRTKEKKFNSKGEEVITNYKYPRDYFGESLPTTPPDNEFTKGLYFLAKNNTNLPIEVYQEKSNFAINGTIKKFKSDTDNIPYHYSSYNTESNLPISSFDISHIDANNELIIDDHYNKIISHKYDNNYNIIQYNNRTNNSITILWGYNYMYPVAKIENSTFDDVMGAIDDAQSVTYDQLQLMDSEELQSLFDIIRNNSRTSGNILQNTMISSYTYDPLIGITSITLPNGKKTTYDFDDFNRLENVINFDSNIIEHFDYHYYQE